VVKSIRALASAVILAGVLACSSATAGEGIPDPSILFIGNSLMYANDLPGMFSSVAKAAGDSVVVAMVAKPNLAVIDHTNGSTDAVAQIDAGRWTFVVLQQGPTPAGICRDTLVIAAMRLAPHIVAAGGRAVLFLPWARQAFPQSLEYVGQSSELAAQAVGGVVAPIGIAWKDALDADAAAPLYGPDGYHPAPTGTLLAALTLYDRLFASDVRTIPTEPLSKLVTAGLRQDQVQALTAAAHKASVSLPTDSPTPVPADTTKLSAGEGPC
jgi:hypothetical protein